MIKSVREGSIKACARAPVLARKHEGTRITLIPPPPAMLDNDEDYHVRHGWRADSKAENKLIKNWTFELYINDEPIKMKHRYFMIDGLKRTSFCVYFEPEHFEPGTYNFTRARQFSGQELHILA